MADESTEQPGTGDAPLTPSPTGTAPLPSTSGQTALPTGFTYKEDRSNWIPKSRFDEINTRGQQTNAQLLTTQQELASERKRVQALAGVTPQDPNEQNAEKVRNAFYEMFPAFKHFAKLSDEQIQQLVSTPDRMQDISQAEQRRWQQHGNQQVAAISEQVADALGMDKLSPRQESTLRTSFTAWLKSTAGAEFQASNGQGSDTLRRYEDGDSTVIESFVKEYVADFITPARRQATAQTINRNRPVPNSGGRSQVTSPARPETFKDLDERIAYGAELFKERGGSFGR